MAQTNQDRVNAMSVEQQIKANAAILSAFQNPDNGFAAKFRATVKTLSTGITTNDGFQETLDALRVSVNDLLASSSGTHLVPPGATASDLGRQKELFRTMRDSNPTKMDSRDYGKIASMVPERAENNWKATPMPKLSPPYSEDINGQLDSALARLQAQKCTHPEVFGGTSANSTTLPSSPIMQKSAACIRT